jgi:hypothetical protein
MVVNEAKTDRLYTVRITSKTYNLLKTYGIVMRVQDANKKWSYYCDAYQFIEFSKAVALRDKLKGVKGIKPLILTA